MSRTVSILVVEDDAAIRRGLVDALSFAGYRVTECADGGRALDLAVESAPDLVLLDVMLPNRNGFDILADLRRTDPALPVIMVTAKGAESDRVNGLSGGADDYVVKPFSPRELLARIDAVLRRSPGRATDVASIRHGGRMVDLLRREVSFDGGGARAALSEREAGILRYLCVNRGRAVDRDELLHRVWGLDPRGMATRTVDMHIVRLREKLGDQNTDDPIIITVRGKGYMLCDRVTCEEARRSADA
jgi:DNA-binding response OmpR family regulator